MKRKLFTSAILISLALATTVGCNSKLPVTDKKGDPQQSGNQQQDGLRSGDTLTLAGDGYYSIGLNLKSNVEAGKLYIVHSMTELAALSTIRADTTPLVDFSKSSILIVRGQTTSGIAKIACALTWLEEHSYKFTVNIDCNDATVAQPWQLCVEAPVTAADQVALELNVNGDDGSGNNPPPPGTPAVLAIDSKIHIWMEEAVLREGVAKGPASLLLHCSTEKMYPALYPIVVDYRQSSGNIVIWFLGVNTAGPAPAAIGPASATVDLGALDNGTYNLTLSNPLSNRMTTYTGVLTVSSGSYRIDLDDNPDFCFTNNPLNKTPENTIWGEIFGIGGPELPPPLQSFLDELVNLGATAGTYSPGYYYGFQIDSSGNISLPPRLVTALYSYFDKAFIFHYSGDTAPLEQLVKKYAQYARDQGMAGLEITLYTDKGERFLSWMY